MVPPVAAIALTPWPTNSFASPGRRDHILAATARLRTKYDAKLVNARRSDPDGADAAERHIAQIEKDCAATLSNAA